MEKKKSRIIIESVIILTFFLCIGIWQWQASGAIFFIINFGYIGLAIAVGNAVWGLLPKKQKIWGRRTSQLLVGLYMLGFLGFLGRENMQIEGFFYYLLAGVFAGATLHYFIAKIAGPLIFGRGWCGWACWTAMVLDFLPWKKPEQGRLRYAGLIRYLHFFISMAVIVILWFGFEARPFGQGSAMELRWLIAGNIVYYLMAIVLAAMLKDNRAFCKYVCPISVLMKIGARAALLKIEIDAEKCSECRICEIHCPMNIKLLDYFHANKRITSTECIFCQNCINVCPRGAVKVSAKFDMGFKEHIQFRTTGKEPAWD